MKNTLRLVAAAVLLLPAALTARAEDKKETKKVRVLLIDGQNNHNWKATTPQLKKALEECGRFAVSVSTTPQPGGTQPQGKDAVPFPPGQARAPRAA